MSHVTASIKKIVPFAWPISFSAMLRIFPNMAAMYILSFLGKEQLAAAAIAGMTYFTLMTFFLTGFNAVGIKVAFSVGEKKQHKEVTAWVHSGLALALALCIPIMILSFNLDRILLFFGQSEHLVAISKPFFYFGGGALCLLLLGTVFNQYIMAIGYPKVSLRLSYVATPLMIIVSYVLILGVGGLPAFALGGVNLSAMLVNGFIFIVGLLIVIRASWSKPYAIVSWQWCGSMSHIVDLIKLGLPISLQVSGELLAATVLTYMLGHFGESALAASQIVQQYGLLFIMLSVGFSQAVSMLISRLFGEKDYQAIASFAQGGLWIIAILACVFATIFILFPGYLIDLFLKSNMPSHGQVHYYGEYFLIIAGGFALLDGLRKVLAATLRGLGDSKTPMFAGVAALWGVGLPVAYVSGFVFPGGAIAMRAAYLLGMLALVAFLGICTYRQIKSLPDTLLLNEPLE